MPTFGKEGERASSLDRLTPANREDVRFSLDNYASLLSDIQKGDDKEIAYADTAIDSELLDSILGDVPEYRNLLEERTAASKKAMQGKDDAERQQGVTEALAWIEKVRALVPKE